MGLEFAWFVPFAVLMAAENDNLARERRRRAIDAALRAVTEGPRTRLGPMLTVPDALLVDVRGSFEAQD